MKERVLVKMIFICMTAFFLSVFILCSSQASWAKDKNKNKNTKPQQAASGDNVKWTKSPDAIPALIQLSNGRKDMIKDLDSEAAEYGKVRSAAEKGALTNGLSIDEVKAKYGEPTVVDTWNREGLTRLIYKKPSKDIASKEKISLTFDKDGKLTGWEEPK